jgi:hypothetical protein
VVEPRELGALTPALSRKAGEGARKPFRPPSPARVACGREQESLSDPLSRSRERVGVRVNQGAGSVQDKDLRAGSFSLLGNPAKVPGISLSREPHLEDNIRLSRPDRSPHDEHARFKETAKDPAPSATRAHLSQNSSFHGPLLTLCEIRSGHNTCAPEVCAREP